MTQTLRISEIFHSIQGEGPSAGTPAHFIRLQGCDVGCHWCDTKYSWDPRGGSMMTAEEACEDAQRSGSSGLLVVTGGEPLQHAGVETLLRLAVKRWPRVEVETSGLEPPPLANRKLFYNVSPKLPSATPRWPETWEHVALWIANKNATFKIVVSDDPDFEDACRLIEENRIPPARVMLMPEGMTDHKLRSRALTLADGCKRRGYRMSPRLHIWLWGAQRGI